MRVSILSALLLVLGFATAGCGSSSSSGGGAAVGAQVATIQVDLATLAVTVTQQPSNLALNADVTASWAGAGNPLTFNLGATNGYPRLLFNLKGVCTDITGDAGATASGDGTYDSDPFFYYGPNALDLAATESRLVTVDGVTATTGILELTIEFVNHNMLFGTSYYYGGNLQWCDSSGTGMEGEIDIDQFGNVGYGGSSSSGYSNPMVGCVSPDGRYYYCGCRNQPAFITVDLTTMTPTLGTDLTGANNIKMDSSGTGSIGFTRAVVMSPDAQFLYASLVINGHMYENVISAYESLDCTAAIVKIDRATMTEVGRATLLTGVDEVMPKMLSISADGRRGAVALKVYSDSYGHPAALVHGKFATLDLTTMSHRIHDVSSVGVEISLATISPAGDQVYLMIDDAGDDLLRRYDVGSGGIFDPSMLSTVGSATSFTLEYGKRMVFGPDGRLYIASYNGFAIYNPSTDAISEPTTTSTYAYDLAFASRPEGTRYYIMRSDELVECFDITTDTSVPALADGAPEIDAPDLDDGHAFAITPF